MNKMDDKPKVCNCPHHKVGPWIFILIGIDFILGGIGFLGGEWMWILLGVLVLILGIVKLNGRNCGCCSK